MPFALKLASPKVQVAFVRKIGHNGLQAAKVIMETMVLGILSSVGAVTQYRGSAKAAL
jgi:hypothetical protein